MLFFSRIRMLLALIRKTIEIEVANQGEVANIYFLIPTPPKSVEKQRTAVTKYSHILKCAGLDVHRGHTHTSLPFLVSSSNSTFVSLCF